ncbi:hypothetical protein DFH07DRAFT_879501 [Mycena maculata]|uniref:Glycosyltransferase family 18 catalytic domain-containing protein n=1 Tax=Mycena maculata TaxID=230809 RepID=A0AAD7NQP4_9AGAR|nr:hypothetical protein DFH07DRAFT_879501 [Mycena maculata]
MMTRVHRRSGYPMTRRAIAACLVFLVSVGTFYLLWMQEYRKIEVVNRLPDSPPRPPSPVPSVGISNALFPVLDQKLESWVSHNQRTLRSLFQCLTGPTAGCGQNQTKVVILGSYHFVNVLQGHVSGEDIWARSTVQALKNMGYTYLYGYNGEKNMDRTIQLYQMFPDLVKAILVEDPVAYWCFSEGECVRSDYNPNGLPIWKIFSFSFWVQAAHPLGHDWTLSPEDYHKEHSYYVSNNYLGYSVEPGCLTRPFIPHELRISPPKVYVMGKEMEYFTPRLRAWGPDFYDDAAKATGAEFMAGAVGDEPPDFPKSVEKVGMLPQNQFYETLAETALLIGIGLPWTSPTPYDALCLGVPFLNPILDWDRKDPMNRDKWIAQQGTLKDLDPPYVYNVFKGDKEGFMKAVEGAIAHPIQRYILDRMRMGAVEQRLSGIIEKDWKTAAIVLLKERRKSGEQPLFAV